MASILLAIYALWPSVNFRLPDKKDLLPLTILALIGISFYHTGVTFGEQTITAGTAGLIIGSSPIFSSIIAMFVLKERLGIYGWSGLGIGFIGVILITLGTADSFSLASGAILLLLSAIATSIFFVFQKPFLRRYKPVELTAFFTWSGTIPFFLYAPGITESLQQGTLEAHISTIFTAIFPTAIAYVTWSTALSLGKASAVTSMMYLIPAIAVFVAWIWLNELPSMLSIIGGGIALAGVILVNSFGKRRSPTQVPSKKSA